MKAIRATVLVAVLLTLTTLSFAPQEARVLRFPAVSADQIVFSSAGDLYTVPIAGGIARKLTSFYEGYEIFARFSPDGDSIAFTGEYDGNREVYLIPSGGGVPKRLTYTPSLGRDDISDRMGPNNLVMGWTHDGERIVFRSRMAEWNDFNGQLYLASKNGGTPERIPLPRGGFCSFSPDDTKLAYNRIFREFRTWKRYRGGMADDIWIYDFDAKTVENVTANPALDIIPMWSGDRIYFLSDRDENKRMNLYVYDLASKATRQLTDFAEFDIKFPSLGPKPSSSRTAATSTPSTWPRRKRSACRSSSPTTRSRSAAAWSRSTGGSPTTRSRRTASGPCSAPAATSSRSRPSTATPAT